MDTTEQPAPLKVGKSATILSYPSILKQGRVGFYEFPPVKNTEYFNCAIADWNGERCLVARRRCTDKVATGLNDLVVCPVKDDKVKGVFPIAPMPEWKDEHQEDPRCLVRSNGALIISYTAFRFMKSFGQQRLCALSPDAKPPFKMHESHNIVYGNNGERLLVQSFHEKNWTWFEYEGVLHFVYTINPFHIVARTSHMKVEEDYWTDAPEWDYGQMRGGSNPVRVGDVYYCFFHSCLDHPTYRRIYFTGAYAFSAKPPFGVISCTQEPLLCASEQDIRNEGAPIVTFPCGAIYENDEWLVTLGVNDCACAWFKISHTELLAKLFPFDISNGQH